MASTEKKQKNSETKKLSSYESLMSAKMIGTLYFRGFASPFMHCNSDSVKIASPATKTNYISMMSRQSFDQVNELTWLIFFRIRHFSLVLADLQFFELKPKRSC